MDFRSRNIQKGNNARRKSRNRKDPVPAELFFAQLNHAMIARISLYKKRSRAAIAAQPREVSCSVYPKTEYRRSKCGKLFCKQICLCERTADSKSDDVFRIVVGKEAA